MNTQLGRNASEGGVLQVQTELSENVSASTFNALAQAEGQVLKVSQLPALLIIGQQHNLNLNEPHNLNVGLSYQLEQV